MAATLNLAHAHRTRRHVDLLAVYTWLGEERALVVISALRRGAAWFAFAESANMPITALAIAHTRR